MPTWERMWDGFIQEEIVEASGQRQQQQQQIGQGEEDLALWTKGKKKGPNHRGVEEEREAVVRAVVRGEIWEK
jgi:hypothetical protein